MKKLTDRKWFYPLVYFVLIVISMFPPITEFPYDPRNTQDVILQILMVSINPYQAWGWVFHIATFALLAVIYFLPKVAGRLVAAYFGVNYLIIAVICHYGQVTAMIRVRFLKLLSTRAGISNPGDLHLQSLLDYKIHHKRQVVSRFG